MTVYPDQIDTDLELPRVDNNVTEIGGDAINSLRDAVLIIERTLGTNPQGTKSSLADRLNVSIESNGDLKTSALAKRGLITLPITNTHIASNAGILESKLDLDYSTSFLNSSIQSNVNDIDTIRDSFNAFAAQTINHFLGNGNRHDGYAINIVETIRSDADDVETALHLINNALLDHESSASAVHAAFGITVSNEFNNFSATNVQIALEQLDILSTGQVHQDNLHQNGIGLNERGEQGSFGNLKETTLTISIFQTDTSEATNILQVMRPNVARITSNIMDFRALATSSASMLRVQAGGVNRDPLDINFSSIIPSVSESVLTANEITLDQIIETINTAAHSVANHYPITAYNTDGHLTIAHNIPGAEFTIQILDSVQFSAATALGFADVVDTTFEWAGNYHNAYVGGLKVNDIVSLVKTRFTHSTSPLNILNLGIDLSELGLSGNEGRLLVNITNHDSTSTDNGTHYITGFPSSSSITLSSDIQNGEFDLEIAADGLNFENSASGEIFDIFLEYVSDGYGRITKSKRVSYGLLSGVSLKSISDDFPASGVEWQITSSSQIQLLQNNEAGAAVSIPSASFIGELKVYAPDNKNSALFDVSGLPATGKRTITVFTSAKEADKLYLGSVHYSGNFGLAVLKFATDKRLRGASLENSTEDSLNPILLEKTLSGLRNNGVIDGFDIISSDQTSFRIRGGRALVDGRLVEVETQTLAVGNLSSATRLLLLDKSGKYILKHEFDDGFTFDELIEGTSYGDNRNVVPIAEFNTNGVEIEDGYFIDRRLIIGKIDKRLLDLEDDLNDRIDQVAAATSGSSWGFTEVSVSIEDGYISSIDPGAHNGFNYIPTGLTGDTTPAHAQGFTGGINPFISTRRFEFADEEMSSASVFKSVGLTHINVFVEVNYTGDSGGPFGVSDTVYIELGIAVETGMSNITESEAYARVKTILVGVLPSGTVTERYVASIPISSLELSDNVLFRMTPRVKIINSIAVNGGTGPDPEPMMTFDHVRIVNSSYSIAGSILEQDGTTTPLAADLDEVL